MNKHTCQKVIKFLPTIFALASAFSVTACRRADASTTRQTTEAKIQASKNNETFEITINTEKYNTSYKPSENKNSPSDNLTTPESPLIYETEKAAEISPTETTPESSSKAYIDLKSKNGYTDGAEIGLNSKWKYSEFSEINSGKAKMYLAKSGRKNKIIGVNAGHGTKGGTNVETYCHPDKTPKVTGGTTSAGATKAVAVSSGMTFKDGIKESEITLKAAQLLRDRLLSEGYDVLMLRDDTDVQLDNIARTVICNNTADCHISLHWDGDGLNYDKGCFYMSVPDGIKYLDSVKSSWQQSEALGEHLINGLEDQGMKIWKNRSLDMDLTQTSYSFIPSIDIELGNQSSDHSEAQLKKQVEGLVNGINSFYGFTRELE